MEAKGFLIPLLVLAIWAVEHADCDSHHTHSQPPSPAPTTTVDCSTLVMEMTNCLTFVTKGSNVTKPEAGCCSGLGTVLKNGPQCLCQAYKTSAELGIAVDATKALTLPAICKLPASKATDCGLSGSPTAAPANSPGSSQTGGGSAAGAPASLSSQNSGSSPLPFSAGAIAIGLAVCLSLVCEQIC